MPTKRLLAHGLIAVAVHVVGVSLAFAQGGPRLLEPVTRVASASLAELHGLVLDDRGLPIPGAVVSALGTTTVFAVSDREGRFTLRNLIPGPYLVRAHLQGYVPAHGRLTQVSANVRNTSRISMARRGTNEEAPRILQAGIGPGEVEAAPTPDPDDTHDHGETAWRLRHLKRSVLREAAPGVIDGAGDDSLFGEPFAGLGRAVGDSARIATSLLSEIPLTGQINILTTTSFDRPQDLFSTEGLMPRGVAHIALASSTAGGEWKMRGALTEGDLASWILAGSYERTGDVTHRYQAGMSYGMQRYLGGNAEALAAVTDGSRNAGSVYAFDNWALNPQLTLNYGARYARYDYLADRSLLSPKLGVTVRPSLDDPLRFRAFAARREIAPGAEEFLPPSTGIWLPPERTLSPLTPGRRFVPEQIDHVELAAERPVMGDVLLGVRAFRQHVDDQLVTMFGVELPGKAPSKIGHYYVASGGSFEARGWGVSVAREFAPGVRASVDYTMADTHWAGTSPDAMALAMTGASALRDGRERVHDVTSSFEGAVPATDTRVFVLYKVNNAFAAPDTDASAPTPGVRFDVQVNQELPFMNFTNAQWEMLVAVRNVFREEALDSSVYDELLVVRPPKRIVGGITVRF